MLNRRICSTIAFAAALVPTLAFGQVADPAKYPDWSGIWRGKPGANQWDENKPIGLPQEPPYMPEYQAIFEKSLADQKLGSQGNNVRFTCMPSGMPRTMTVLFQIEFVITPKITYLMLANNPSRRIYTDGSGWRPDDEPSFTGHSVGRWLDTDGDGKYDTLEVETRNIRGHRTFDNTGMPLHEDNQTVVKERIYADNKAVPEKIFDEITTIDHALSRPWTVTKSYIREKSNVPWIDIICGEANPHVMIAGENYFLSAEGFLMPARKNQAPPDLRYFK